MWRHRPYNLPRRLHFLSTPTPPTELVMAIIKFFIISFDLLSSAIEYERSFINIRTTRNYYLSSCIRVRFQRISLSNKYEISTIRVNSFIQLFKSFITTKSVLPNEKISHSLATAKVIKFKNKRLTPNIALTKCFHKLSK